jgi:hypothetical protein
MKNLRRIFVACALMVLAITASAQLNYGVRAGFNASGYTGKDIPLDYKAGFNVGLMAQLNIPVVGLGIESGLYFSRLGAQRDEVSKNPYYLQLPVQLIYKFGLGDLLSLYPAAGIYFGYGLGGKCNDNGQKVNFFGDGVKRFDTGLSVGLNLQVLKFIVGVGYDYGLTKLYSSSEAPHNSNVKVSLAYLF